MKYGGYTSVTEEDEIIEIDDKWAEILLEEDRRERKSQRNYYRHISPLEYLEDPKKYALYKSEDANLAAITEIPDKELLNRALPVLADQEADVIECIFFKGMKGYEYADAYHLSRSKVSRIKKKAISKLKTEILRFEEIPPSPRKTEY